MRLARDLAARVQEITQKDSVTMGSIVTAMVTLLNTANASGMILKRLRG